MVFPPHAIDKISKSESVLDSSLTDIEIRLKCVEYAARANDPFNSSPLDRAIGFYEFVTGKTDGGR